MPRGPHKWTEQTIEKLHREGRGKGHGDKYLPWIYVSDVSSNGRSRRAHGIKTGREHHLLSDIEWNLFLLLEYCQDVIDIREQFPLDRDLTQEIAATLGIRHPCYPGTRVPIVMTTDFLVTRVRNGEEVLEAFDTKHEQDAEDERSLEKLQIQRAYLEGAGIPHNIVFNSTIPLQKSRNIEWVRSAHVKPGEMESFHGILEDASQKITGELPSYSKRSITLTEYCNEFDYRHGYAIGTGLRAARLLIANHELITDLGNPNLQTCPLSAFRLTGGSYKVRVGVA